MLSGILGSVCFMLSVVVVVWATNKAGLDGGNTRDAWDG